jgi:hypothetical protein
MAEQPRRRIEVHRGDVGGGKKQRTESDMAGDGLWSFVVIAGPIILVAALLFAILRNRRSRHEEARTEDATRTLYKEQSAEDRARTP